MLALDVTNSGSGCKLWGSEERWRSQWHLLSRKRHVARIVELAPYKVAGILGLKKRNEGPSDKEVGKLTIRPTTGTVQSLRTAFHITRLVALCWDSLLTRYGSYDGADISEGCTLAHLVAISKKNLSRFLVAKTCVLSAPG